MPVYISTYNTGTHALPNIYTLSHRRPQISCIIISGKSLACIYLHSLLHMPIYRQITSYRAWCCITSFIDHTLIKIYVRQKDKANQWKVMVLEEFLHNVLLYQVITVRIINV